MFMASKSLACPSSRGFKIFSSSACNNFLQWRDERAKVMMGSSFRDAMIRLMKMVILNGIPEPWEVWVRRGTIFVFKGLSSFYLIISRIWSILKCSRFRNFLTEEHGLFDLRLVFKGDD